MRHALSFFFVLTCSYFSSTQICGEEQHAYIFKETEAPQPFLNATKIARQSVVSIVGIEKEPNSSWESIEDDIPISQAAFGWRGSGFIISEDGYIVTNHHVVDHTESLSVTLLDGREYDAVVIESDPTTDIALIKIDEEGLPWLTFGDSSKVDIGECVIAIGNPYGLQASVSAGIISGDNRAPGGLLVEEFFQTDAIINPGNSGGPLINLDGQVIGMNAAGLVTCCGGNTGVGFSIPSNLIQDVLQDLMQEKKPVRSQLGMLLVPVDIDTARSYGMTSLQGAIVLALTPGGAAEKAGFLPGDLILEWQDYPVKEVGQLRTAIAISQPGQTLSFLVRRDLGDLTLQASTEECLYFSPTQIEEELGIHLQSILVPGKGEGQAGLLVYKIDTLGAGADAGLNAGDIIMLMNNTPVTSTQAFSDEAVKSTFFSLTTVKIFEEMMPNTVYIYRRPPDV